MTISQLNDNQSCSLGVPADELDVESLRKQFPIFSNRPGLICFDNAATAQKPLSVLRRISSFYRRDCANAGRSAYRASTGAKQAIEKARQRVAKLINASADDLVFTSGATESLNTVALAWGLTNLKTGDEVMVCHEDHKSCVMPWVNLKALLARFGVEISIVAIDLHLEGDYELKSIRERLSPRTRLVAITHVHHLFGLDMEVERVREIVGKNVLISLDASQSVGHRKVDVKELDVDFMSFSGHKMFAATGVGVLWVSPAVQPLLTAIKSGGKAGGAGSAVTDLLESGTQDIASIISLVPAVDLIERLGIERIESRVSKLSHLLHRKLSALPGIEFAPGFGRCACPKGYGIIAFRFEQLATSDLAFLLDAENIQVRTGDHCIGKRQQGDDWLRVSLHVYNSESEIERFVDVLAANLA